ncbi:SIR2 family protein [Sphingomonas lenta]|uniref:Sir2 family NAD-dependent protein deacetylase n=1 Tax=Sphingomonas lenta TaxID=1141887 RepID=A0A2A2SIG8_9SPHN|nr:SIR2 family protein [Sphingomonas lenta]PAX09015.1 Sir2 family NAD-dependent protein deacetylase [Sphingomonas lenta]
MLEDLARQIRDRKVVLFAGAGLSAQLDLPTWSGLMAHMARELGYDPDVLIRPGADYLQIAEYYRLEKGRLGPLRSWMDRSWHVEDDRLRSSRVHNQIVDLDFPFIYTTNYDRNIERAFDLRGKKYSKIVAMLDVAEAQAELPHIVKFHGDFDDDESLVLTESDYFERLDFDTLLDVKFHADVLGRSILFVGYSISDLNLRLLLFRLQRLWKRSGQAERRPKSYIFLMRPDPVQESVFASRGLTPLIYDGEATSDPLADLFDQLLQIVRNKV